MRGLSPTFGCYRNAQRIALNCVGFRLDYSASVQQCFERLGVIEEQAVIDHLLIVGSQFFQCVVSRNELESTRDGRVIVDDFAMSVLLGEEDAFVIGNCTGKTRVRDCGVGDSAGCLTRFPVRASQSTSESDSCPSM